jgi:hypothetical protein
MIIADGSRAIIIIIIIDGLAASHKHGSFADTAAAVRTSALFGVGQN